MESTEKVEAGVADALKGLALAVDRITKIVFGERQETAKQGRPLAGDLVTEIRNQITELNAELNQSASKLELLR